VNQASWDSACARIAELEAENKWLKERVRLTEAQFCQRAEQLEQAEAELALRDRMLEDLQRIIGKQEQELVEADLKLREAEAALKRDEWYRQNKPEAMEDYRLEIDRLRAALAEMRNVVLDTHPKGCPCWVCESARAEATLAAERARVEQMEPVWLTAMMAVRFYHELGSEFDCAGGMRSIAEAVDATRPAPEEE
jgi:chromosome segregation ATPase